MDFTAYIGHRLNKNDLNHMCLELNSNKFIYTQHFLQEILIYNPSDVNKVWKIETDDWGGTISLDGPCGLTFTFSEHVCMMSHYTRWLTFLLNDLEFDFRSHLRNVSYELTRYFNTKFAIYVPDSSKKESAIMDFLWEDENKSIEFMKKWLLEKCGSPKDEIDSIYVDYEDSWESEGYFIDYFIDYK